MPLAIIIKSAIEDFPSRLIETISNALLKVLSIKTKNNNRKSVINLDENIITNQLIEIYNKAINKK